MSERNDEAERANDPASRLPSARVARRFRWSWVWLVPLVALGLVGYFVYMFVAKRGPMIAVSFETAEGLSENQTKVRYKAVTLGTVEDIEISDDLSHVVAHIRMTDRAEPLLTENARFWVVRPRLNSGLHALQTGLETLVSGAYVAVDPGKKGGAPQTQFKGLEKPPSVRSDEAGTGYALEGESLDGVGVGAPVFYHDIQVGEVLSQELLRDGDEVKLGIFVRAPYDRKVVSATRFWDSSGLRVGLDPGGIRVSLASASSLFSGAIAFHTPDIGKHQPQSKPESTFRLYANRELAEIGFYRTNIPCVSYFRDSVRGLEEGSEVRLFGKTLGAVTKIELVRDPRAESKSEFAVRVAYVLQPERALGEADSELVRGDGIRKMVADRLRVVLKTSNLLTGQQMLSLEYVPDSEPATLTREGDALVLPGRAQSLRDLSESVSEIASQINSIPFEQIGVNLNRTLATLERTIGGPELRQSLVSLNATLKDVRQLARHADAGLTPALRRLPEISQKLETAVEHANLAFGQSGYGSDSTVQRNLERVLDQVADAARSIRLLADYLNRHPEALVTGREEGEP